MRPQLSEATIFSIQPIAFATSYFALGIPLAHPSRIVQGFEQIS